MAETTDRILLLTPSQVALFWSKIEQSPDPEECWPWLGYVNEDGYGAWSVRIGGRAGVKITFYAHRLAYALTNGPIKKGFEAAHSIYCSTPACCRPSHITPKSHWDNLRDIPTRKALALVIGVTPDAHLTQSHEHSQFSQ